MYGRNGNGRYAAIDEEGDRPADDPAVEDDAPLPVLNDVPERLDLLSPVLEAVEEPGADQSGEEDPEGHIQNDLGIELLAPGPPVGQPGRGDERQHDHRAEAEDANPPKIGIVNRTCRMRADSSITVDHPCDTNGGLARSGPAWSAAQEHIVDQAGGPDTNGQQSHGAAVGPKVFQRLERFRAGDLGVVEPGQRLGFYRFAENLSNPVGLALPGQRRPRGRFRVPERARRPPFARRDSGSGCDCSSPARPALEP